MNGFALVNTEPQSAPPNPRVLVVDDDPDALGLFATSLEFAGFSVTTAADGVEALRAEPGRFDAITTDICMPRMDGRELVQRLRDLPSPPVPVVAVTAHRVSEAANETVRSCRVLTKPCDLEELARTLRWLLTVCGHSRSSCVNCPCSPPWAVRGAGR
jgi:two-component system, OmpR family, response regulator